MISNTHPPASGSYSASLLGTIRSHLEGLQGYDVMALELIQNADDAKAEEILFDITDHGLLVTNSGTFTYCGDLNSRPCSFHHSQEYSCDYHRITEVASGGKLSRGENIGRFGIGFVSTYQITDHPEIRSAGIKLTLHPESGQWFVEPYNQQNGTTFFLPWASDPNTEARCALGVSHVSTAHIDQLVIDFQTVLRKSLLFLRHVRKAEVRRNGHRILACDLNRNEGSDLKVTFHPSEKVEHWHILRADAKVEAEVLYKTHPRLELLGRCTEISIGLRIAPEPLDHGYLYAFLPTEQSTGLPLHINADFFPEADRKALIFSGHQHQEAWNAMLVGVAANELARDLEALLQKLGHTHLWQILSSAFVLSKSSHYHASFAKFWERLKATGTRSRIALDQDGSPQYPKDVLLTDKLNKLQVATLHEIGGKVLIEELRPFRNTLIQLDAPVLTLDRLVTLIAQAFSTVVGGTSKVTEQRVENFYRPLWSVVDNLLPDNTTIPNVSVTKLKTLPFVVTEHLFNVTINQSYVANPPLQASKVVSLLPRLAVLSNKLPDYPRILRLVAALDLSKVALHLKNQIASAESSEMVIGAEKTKLRDLYNLFADLDRQSPTDRSVYQTLRTMPIWLSRKGLVTAEKVLLPGNFIDPTGYVNLLDPNVFTSFAREFVINKLDVHSQTIKAFVQTVLPDFFTKDGPAEPPKYLQLISELASHPELINDDESRHLLASLPLIPTQDGHWRTPLNVYRRTEELVQILGDSGSLWLDDTKVPKSRSVLSFLNDLGILKSPIARHLVERICNIAQHYKPTASARRASGEAFYVLCDNYVEWKDKKAFKVAISGFKGLDCFPADNDEEKWYNATELFTPIRAEAFKSQVRVLDFKNNKRLKVEFLEELGVSTIPGTQLVIDHLLHCVEHGIQPHIYTYQVLNERAQKGDKLIDQLKNKRSIYVERQKLFARPNQLYWIPQQLGRYAFTIPGNQETFRPLFNTIGVRNEPEPKDYIDFLLDIVGEHFEQGRVIEGADRSVYEACLTAISKTDTEEELEQSELTRLKEAPTILNLLCRPTHPDELLLHDSEWHAAFFEGELNQALCKPAPEFWPLLKRIGVERLSECAEVSCEFVDGVQQPEALLAGRLVERAVVLLRLLHDKPTCIKEKIAKALTELSAFSYDLVRIQATVNIGDNLICAPPTPVQAFYDIDKNELILARPVNERIWSHLFNALLHQLMPEESGSEISKLTLILRPLMAIPVEEANRELSEAGVPPLYVETHISQEDLTSPELNDIGTTDEPDNDTSTTQEISTEVALEQSFGATTTETAKVYHFGHISEAAHVQPTSSASSFAKPSINIGGTTVKSNAQSSATVVPPRPGELVTPTQKQSHYEGPAHQGYTSGGGTQGLAGSTNSRQNEGDHRRPRSKHKELWDRRLLSYVRMKVVGNPDSEPHAYEHNLAVEVVARAAVTAYEKKRGRVPEQMPQTHPGYDIISRDPLSGEERFIEVKGVNGEWNKTGVGLSKLQFYNAQDYGQRYWLYVVELVSSPQLARVHPICSPASQVTGFMFDGSWRAAVTEECADPTLAFIAGRNVKHKSFGNGHIKSMDLRGSTRVMSIDFEKLGNRTVTLNLQQMEIVEDDCGNFDS